MRHRQKLWDTSGNDPRPSVYLTDTLRSQPYEAQGAGVKNLKLSVPKDRFGSKRELLGALDRRRAGIEASDALDSIQKQSYEMLLGRVAEAFDVKQESEASREQYGSGVGEQLLLARRLVEAGTKFVTLSYGGWDMHSNISNSLKGRVPPVDKALAAFIRDIHARNMQKDVLLVVTGEFGRTYKINLNAGRDHWPRLSPLMLSGGNFDM